ncbi:MAG: PPC domain-containing protein [Microcystaceae cyanobacterium]
MATAIDSIDTSGEIDWFPIDLIGGIDYVAAALGSSNSGGTLQNPALLLVDGSGNLLTYADDSFALGSDPLLQFKAPSSGTYFLGVADFTGSVGSYTVSFDQAGVPSPINPPSPGAIF